MLIRTVALICLFVFCISPLVSLSGVGIFSSSVLWKRMRRNKANFSSAWQNSPEKAGLVFAKSFVGDQFNFLLCLFCYAY